MVVVGVALAVDSLVGDDEKFSRSWVVGLAGIWVPQAHSPLRSLGKFEIDTTFALDPQMRASHLQHYSSQVKSISISDAQSLQSIHVPDMVFLGVVGKGSKSLGLSGSP